MLARDPGGAIGVRLHARQLDAPAGIVQTFEVEGLLHDRPVSASWTSESGLACDPMLRTHAALLVDMIELFEDGNTVVAATLTGSGEAILLTLLRACDRVTSMNVRLRAAS